MQTVQEVEKHVPVREGDYGERVATVEPGGVEYISLKERHGKPIDLFWTWLSPNLEFATVYVGVLGIAVFGLSFWQTAVAIVVGSALGSLTHWVLSSWGPKFGVPMMVESRGAFGFLGNILPAGLNAFTGSIGWFIVNSVSGAFALQALGGLANLTLPFWLTFLIIVVAQVAIATLGHNFIHFFERWSLPLLGIVFALAVIAIFRGVIEKLESRFAAILGKEQAVFLPTGTLANHLAVRLLAGPKRRVLAQEQSHLYNDTGDCVPRLSGNQMGSERHPDRPAQAGHA